MRSSLVLVALMLSGCAGRDLAVLCEVATESAKAPDDPAENAQKMAKQLDERLSRFGDTRKAMRALGAVSAEQRYPILKQAAKEMGHPEWECPAIEAWSAKPGLKAETTCAPWAGASSLVAREQAGRGDFFREFYFELATGTVRLHDSDPFANGAEEKVARVLKKENTVEGARREAMVKALQAICPSDEAMKRQCAPGGCSRLEVADGKQITKVDDPETVTAVMKVFTPLFPELRTR